jgi:hypothetical protein
MPRRLKRAGCILNLSWENPVSNMTCRSCNNPSLSKLPKSKVKEAQIELRKAKEEL